MAISIIDIVRENSRQSLTGDDNFYKKKTYMFKLISESNKGSCGPTGNAFFPLPLAPEEIEYDLPFATQITPTQEGGTISEERGIITGMIVISGSFGFRLKRRKDTSSGSGNPRFTGLIPKKRVGKDKLSGQFHIFRFMGRCFDAYSELKKDPKLNSKTSLEWHDLHNSKHLEVVPRSVRIIKNKSPYRLYPGYRIELIVLGPAKQPTKGDLLFLGDDKNIFTYMTDASSFLRNGISALKGTIDDFTACANEFKRNVSNFVNILDDVKSVNTAVSNFIEGTKSYVDLPEQFMSDLTDTVESAQAVVNDINSLPDKAKRSFQNLGDQLDALKAGVKGSYRPGYDSQVNDINSKIQGLLGINDQQQDIIDASELKASEAAGTMSIANVYGTYSPGDKERQNITAAIPDLKPGEYTGFSEVKVQQGDTLTSLALKHMGNTSKWKAIAVINRLRPPYISNSVRVPGTLRRGDPIVVPINQPTTGLSTLTTGDSGVGKSQAEDKMGTDFKWVLLDNNKWSWVIDSAHGSTDCQTVRGIDNLSQGLQTRLRTEQGTNLIFPEVGIPDLIGNNGTDQLFEELRYAMEEQILSDPRIEQLNGISYDLDQDVLTVTIDAQPIGFDTQRPIPVTLYE